MYKITLFLKGIILLIVLNFPSNIFAQVGIGLTNPTAQLTVNEDAIFNESGGDHDFRIETDTQANMLFVDASTNRIGVNTNLPLYTMQVVNVGNIGAAPLIDANNTGIDGLGMSAYNTGTSNGYNAIEGITNYNGTSFVPSGILGLAINASATSLATGVTGFTNGTDGIGVFGGRLGTTGVSGWGGLFVNDLGYTGFFGAASDKRLKTNIKNIESGLSIINQLNPVTYNFDLKKYPNMGLNTEMEYGFIAQEIRTVLPEIVRDKSLNLDATKAIDSKTPRKSNSQEFLVMDYTRIIPILTKAIQEQQSIIESQNSKIETLENKLQLLENKVNQILEN